MKNDIYDMYNDMKNSIEDSKRYTSKEDRAKKCIVKAIILILIVILGIYIGNTIKKRINIDNTKIDDKRKYDSISPKETNNKIKQNNKKTKSLNTKVTNVRVLLKDNSYNNIYHQNVICSGNIGYKIGKEAKYINVNKLSLKDIKVAVGETVNIRSNDNTKGIKINSLKRSSNNTEYKGELEIYNTENGYVIVNEIEVEDYLCKVVPSEMPPSYGLEALKAQAVCARTYTYSHLESYAYDKYKANIDDSTSYQVYNNQDASELADKAVEQTKGQIMKSEGHYVSAYYFSTSCGYTSDVKEVFMTDDNISYLKGKYQGDKEEQKFSAFIKNTQTNCFENDCEWFRWNISYAKKDLAKRVERKVNEVAVSNKKQIKYYDGEKYGDKKLSPIGDIQNIMVSKRADTGIVEEIEIIGSNSNVKVSSQNAIRKVLAPVKEEVKRQDGTSVKNMDLLPSAYIDIEDEGDKIIVYGGGYGHGTGMSQSGAKILAANGADYLQILKHYYTDVDIE